MYFPLLTRWYVFVNGFMYELFAHVRTRMSAYWQYVLSTSDSMVWVCERVHVWIVCACAHCLFACVVIFILHRVYFSGGLCCGIFKNTFIIYPAFSEYPCDINMVVSMFRFGIFSLFSVLCYTTVLWRGWCGTLKRVMLYFEGGDVLVWRGCCGTLKMVMWYFKEGHMVLWRGWCGTLKRMIWYFKEGGVVL